MYRACPHLAAVLQQMPLTRARCVYVLGATTWEHARGAQVLDAKAQEHAQGAKAREHTRGAQLRCRSMHGELTLWEHRLVGMHSTRA